MKRLLKLLFIAVPLLFLSITLLAQPAVDTTGVSTWNPFDGNITVSGLTETFNIIYSVFVIIWGYIAALLGLKTKKVPFVFVVLAGAAVLAGLFMFMEWGKAIPLAISFFLSLGIFDTFLKPIQRVVSRKEIADSTQ